MIMPYRMAGTNLAYVGSKSGHSENPDKNEWRTPATVIDAVKQTLGDIDLDPFSCDGANAVIGAKHIFTKENSALLAPWPFVNTAFANPPFGRSLMSRCVDAWVQAYSDFIFREGILLCNNATETKWFKQLLNAMSALCVVDYRIAFKRPNGTPGTDNTRGQIIFYFGDNSTQFKAVFSDLGTVLVVL